MNNEKLMQIVQAVNDSKGEPIDILLGGSYDSVARSIGEFKFDEVYAVSGSSKIKSWQYICTVEEFNQCVKEMSAGYGKKENSVNNKHPHYDLIVEWAKGTGKKIEKIIGGKGFDSNIQTATADIGELASSDSNPANS